MGQDAHVGGSAGEAVSVPAGGPSPTPEPSDDQVEAAVRWEWVENRGHLWPDDGYENEQVGAILRDMRDRCRSLLRAAGAAAVGVRGAPSAAPPAGSGTSGEAGGPSPLDLGAIEARLRLPQVQQHAAPVGAWHDAQALLSLLRETRAALRDARWDAGSGSPCWCDAALDSQELHSMRCREIATVLGAAQDGEGEVDPAS